MNRKVGFGDAEGRQHPHVLLELGSEASLRKPRRRRAGQGGRRDPVRSITGGQLANP